MESNVTHPRNAAAERSDFDNLPLSAPLAKPRLRGVLHLTAFPISAVLGVILVLLAHGNTGKAACAIYAVAIAQLFGVSALYHRGRWGPKTGKMLQRIDHADIYLAIAGSYTPIGLLLLHGAASVAVLAVVWGGAFAGIILSIAWPSAPRIILVPTYVVVGWAAVFVLPEIMHQGGVAVMVLVVAGGLMYTAGGIIYALKKPNPAPRTFGFHEVFHSCTIAAWIVQYIAISMAAYRF